MKVISSKFIHLLVSIAVASTVVLSETMASVAALPIVSTSADVLFRRAYVLMQNGAFHEATGVLEHLVRLNPNDPRARRYLVYALVQLNDCESAAAQLKVVSKLTSLTAADYFLSGCINVRMGHNGRALTEYKSALKLQPEMPAAKAGIIELFVLASDFQGATFLCRDCLEKARTQGDINYFQKVAESVRLRKLAFDAETIASQSTSGPVLQTAPQSVPLSVPVPRELIPSIIQAPLLAPPKLAPIATKAKA